MPHRNQNFEFTASHHALLFSSIAKTVIHELGEIDAALVNGFNPSLKIEVNATRTNDHKPCEFIFRHGKISFFKMLRLVYKKKVRPGKTAIKPWAFHISHLYNAMNDVIFHALGDDRGRAVMVEALKDVSAFIPERHIKKICGEKTGETS